MTKIEKEVSNFISSYQNSKGHFFRVSVPNGIGGQIRKQGFLERSDAIGYAVPEYLRVLHQRKGVRPVVSKVTFREYTDEWLAIKEREGVNGSTLLRYRQEIRNRLNPYFGMFKLAELEKSHFRNYLNERHSLGDGTYIVKFSAMLFKSILKQAEIDDMVVPKGILQLQPPKHRKRQPRFWDQKQLQFFLNATAYSEHHNIWKLVLWTGMRAGEIAGLKWDCVHFDKSFGELEGAIEVKRTYNQKTRKMQETTKNGNRRYIPIFPEVKDLIEQLHKERTGSFVLGGDQPRDSSHFNRDLQRALKEIANDQLPKITFHGLRHSFCSRLDGSGMNRRAVSEIMGHRDLNTTNLYSHMSSSMLGNEVARWADLQSQQKTNKLEVVSF